MSEHRAVEPSGERLVTGYTGRLLVTLSVGYLVIQLGRNILPPLLPAITDDLGISPFLAGVALTALSAAYALSMYPGGRLSDHLTRKTVLVCAAGLGVGGLAALMAATSYPLFVLGVTVFGFGGGLYWIALRALIADLFHDKRGQAFGIQDALGFAGPVIASGTAVVILATASWRVAFPALVVVLTVLLGLAHRWIREPYDASRINFDVVATVVRVFGDRHVRWLAVAYTCVVFSMHAMIGFLPTYLQVEKGFSPTLSSAGFAVLFLGAMVTMPISGALGDRLSHLPVAGGGLAVSVLGLGTLLFADGIVSTGAGIFCFGFGVWAFPPVVQAHLMTRFSDASMGGDFGAFKTVYAGIGSLGPTYVGFVAGLDTYARAFTSLGLCLLAAIGILLRAR